MLSGLLTLYSRSLPFILVNEQMIFSSKKNKYCLWYIGVLNCYLSKCFIPKTYPKKLSTQLTKLVALSLNRNSHYVSKRFLWEIALFWTKSFQTQFKLICLFMNKLYRWRLCCFILENTIKRASCSFISTELRLNCFAKIFLCLEDKLL